MWYRKRGISNVVATVLLILLIFAVIIVLWLVFYPMIKGYMAVSEAGTQLAGEYLEIGNVMFSPGYISIPIRRGRTRLVGTNVYEIPGSIERPVDVFSVVDLSESMADGGSCENPENIDRDKCYPEGTTINYCKKYWDYCEDCAGGTWVYSRLFYAQEANKIFIDSVLNYTGNRVGLVGYRTSVNETFSFVGRCDEKQITSKDYHELSTNYNSLNTIIDSWKPKGSTCICCGINEAVDKIGPDLGAGRLRAIIVMSDGEADTGCGTGNAIQDAIDSACSAKTSGITVHAVGFGSDVNETTLQAIADCGNGRYYNASDVSKISEIYKSIANTLRESYTVSKRNHYLKVFFHNATDTYVHKIEKDIVGSNEQRTYDIDIGGKITNVIKIEVCIGIMTEGGEALSPVLAKWSIDD